MRTRFLLAGLVLLGSQSGMASQPQTDKPYPGLHAATKEQRRSRPPQQPRGINNDFGLTVQGLCVRSRFIGDIGLEPVIGGRRVAMTLSVDEKGHEVFAMTAPKATPEIKKAQRDASDILHRLHGQLDGMCQKMGETVIPVLPPQARPSSPPVTPPAPEKLTRT